jgi:hypothetical protein
MFGAGLDGARVLDHIRHALGPRTARCDAGRSLAAADGALPAPAPASQTRR